MIPVLYALPGCVTIAAEYGSLPGLLYPRKKYGIIVMSEHGWDTEKHLCPMCRGESKDVDIEREILDDYQNLKLKSVLDKYREALLKIRKIRRNKLMPNHEQDEIYNIAVDALNAEDYVCH